MSRVDRAAQFEEVIMKSLTFVQPSGLEPVESAPEHGGLSPERFKPPWHQNQACDLDWKAG